MKINTNNVSSLLRAIAGFDSAITSVIVSCFFAISIYGNTIINGNHYPEYTLSFIILSGPLISGWQFMNVSAILNAITAKLSNEEKINTKQIVPQDDMDIEYQVFGKKTVLLRAIAGFICVHGLCFVSILFSYVLHKNILLGKGYPPDLLVLSITIGPIITSWAFMGANKIINELLGKETITERFKKLMGRIFNG